MLIVLWMVWVCTASGTTGHRCTTRHVHTGWNRRQQAVVSAGRPGRASTHVTAAASEPCLAPPGGLFITRQSDLGAVGECNQSDAVVFIDSRVGAAFGIGGRGWELRG